MMGGTNNPFDNAEQRQRGGGGGGSSSMHQQQHQQRTRHYARRQQQQQPQQHEDRYSNSRHNMNSNSPALTSSRRKQYQQSPSYNERPQSSTLQTQPSTTQQQQPPIFSARGVEWPLPSTLSSQQYRKYRKESKVLGASLGITSSGLSILLFNTEKNSSGGHYGGGSSSAAGDVQSSGGGGGVSAFSSQQQTTQSFANNTTTGDTNSGSVAAGGSSSVDGSSGGGSGGGGGTGYGGLTGLMGRVLGASSSSTAAAGTGGGANYLLSNDIEEVDLAISATRPVFSPRAHCVAASNGWIVAVVECSHPPNVINNNMSSTAAQQQSSSSTGMMMHQQQQQQSKQGLTTLIPPLRLVSRWNVRRGTTLGSEGNHLVPLPPPVRPNITEENAIIYNLGGNYNNNDPNFGRIMHTFVDPTGCHVLLSARNGEAYYVHSTSKSVQKLSGFGPRSDGLYSDFTPGLTLGETSTSSVAAAGGGGGDDKVVQTGLTPGSYVTAVGWDSDRGTEGSTKRILIGTSFGELYEYALLSPNATASTTGGGKAKSSSSSSPFDAKAGEIMIDDGDNDPIDAPILLYRLNKTARTNSGGTSGESRGAQENTTPRSPGRDGGAVSGILFQRVMGGVASAAGGSGGGGSVICLVSTCGLHRHTRLHSFYSEPSTTSSLSLRSAFSSAGGSSKKQPFVELPGSIDLAELCSCSDGSFALRTETGIYYGTLATVPMMGRNVIGSTFDAGMLTYESLTKQEKGSGKGMLPTTSLSLGLTRHHFITLSSVNDVKFVNRVAKKVIQEERVDWVSVSSAAENDLQYGSFREGSRALAELITDIRRPDQIWLRKGRSLVHISSSYEERDVWKYTLARCIETVPPTTSSPRHNPNILTSEEKHIEGQFEHAKSLCNNTTQLAVVNAVRAEYYLSKGRAELASKYMAQSPDAMPFVNTAVRLALPMIGRDNSILLPKNNTRVANEALANSNMALIAFLSEKMKIAKSKNDTVVCTILGTWLTELHLQERERVDNLNAGQQQQRKSRNHATATVNHALLHQFLSSFVGDMDPKTIIKVLASHDLSAGECAGYSAAAGELGAAVNAALSDNEQNGALDALRVLNDSPIEKAEPYYYKYALILLSRAPTYASKSFVSRFSEGLSENKLLSAFMHYEQRRKSNALNPGAPSAMFVNDPNASIRYLEGVIKLGSKSRAIYNYLTSLYASMDDEGPLFRFISEHVPASASSPSSMSTSSVGNLLLKQANEERQSPLDKAYALRTIMRTGRHFRSAVKLYMGFGMRQQAVELALKVDPALARELARQSDDKDETKRLWLLIARNAAANSSSSKDGKDVVARVVMVLKDCGPDVLSIEDVLPFLPDFAQIDQFKDEICDALTAYSSKIEHYLKEMNDCDQACDALREELKSLKTSGTTRVRADARCALTNKPILGQSLYAFPSGYVVLGSALKREVIPYLNEKQAARVNVLEKELEKLRKARDSRGQTSYEIVNNDYEIDELQVELDGLIAAECPLTGSVMVDSIDRGFAGDEEDIIT